MEIQSFVNRMNRRVSGEREKRPIILAIYQVFRSPWFPAHDIKGEHTPLQTKTPQLKSCMSRPFLNYCLITIFFSLLAFVSYAMQVLVLVSSSKHFCYSAPFHYLIVDVYDLSRSYLTNG